MKLLTALIGFSISVLILYSQETTGDTASIDVSRGKVEVIESRAAPSEVHDQGSRRKHNFGI
jgi:hypothetical protein